MYACLADCTIVHGSKAPKELPRSAKLSSLRISKSRCPVICLQESRGEPAHSLSILKSSADTMVAEGEKSGALGDGGQAREQFRLPSQRCSITDMELPLAPGSPAIFKSPAAKVDKENLTSEDTFRSPALDASHSKDQWRTIAIQAAARVNCEVYEEWKEASPEDALDGLPEGAGSFQCQAQTFIYPKASCSPRASPSRASLCILC